MSIWELIFSTFLNVLSKTPCVPIFFFYAYLMAEVLQNTWQSWGDFRQGCFKLPGMKVAQNLLLLLPFRKDTCENSDYIHFKACCYIYKQKWWFFISPFCWLSVGKKKRYRERSTFHRDVLNSTTRKSFPSAAIPLNDQKRHFQACDFGARGSGILSDICSLYPSRHIWIVHRWLKRA